jgi:hypothetical protein
MEVLGRRHSNGQVRKEKEKNPKMMKEIRKGRKRNQKHLRATGYDYFLLLLLPNLWEPLNTERKKKKTNGPNMVMMTIFTFCSRAFPPPYSFSSSPSSSSSSSCTFV